MSDAKKFDEFLKGSFSGYEPDVPQHIWENIIAEREKRRPAAWWTNKKITTLMAACLLLMAVGAFILVKQNHPDNIALENNDHSSTGADKSAPAAVEKSDLATKENTTAQGINDNTLSVNNTGINEQAERINNNEEVEERSNITNKKYSDNTNKAAIRASVKNPKRKKAKYVYTGAAASSINDDSGDQANDDGSSNKNASATDQFLMEPGSRDLLSIALANADKKKIEFRQIPGPACPRAEFDAAGNKQYFELYLGPDYVFKKYSDTGTSLITKRKESLNFRSAYSAGLRYTRVFNNGMSIRGGINYSQVNEKFSYVKDNVVQIVYVINTSGDTTDTYYVRGTRYNNSYNYYRTIDLPVTIGYEMGNGRFHANINTGVVINLYSWQSGETLDNNFSPVSITTGKPNNPYQYKTNVGLGFIGAASLYYKLNEKFHLMAEPYLRYNFSPMNKEAITLQEKFTTVGLRLGLRVDLR